MLPTLTNFVAFQLVWLANCLGAASGYPWFGPVITAIWLSVHFGWFVSARISEAGLIIVSMLLGYAADSLLVAGEWFRFPVETQLGGPSTLWMVALWAGFASTLRHSLKWLVNRPILAAVLGAVFGPLAYFAGDGLGAIELASSWSLVAIGLEWAVSLPLLGLAAQWFETQFSRSRVVVEGMDA